MQMRMPSLAHRNHQALVQTTQEFQYGATGAVIFSQEPNQRLWFYNLTAKVNL